MRARVPTSRCNLANSGCEFVAFATFGLWHLSFYPQLLRRRRKRRRRSLRRDPMMTWDSDFSIKLLWTKLIKYLYKRPFLRLISEHHCTAVLPYTSYRCLTSFFWTHRGSVIDLKNLIVSLSAGTVKQLMVDSYDGSVLLLHSHLWGGFGGRV